MFRPNVTCTALLILISLILASSCFGVTKNDEKQCMILAIESGQYEHLTINQVRQKCTNDEAIKTGEQDLGSANNGQKNGLINQRLAEEQETKYHPFSLTAHRRNYILPVTFNNNPNGNPYEVSDNDVKKVEVKFQFSLKLPIWNNIIGDADLWGAYTNISFWQAYNKTHSSPFRDTNHEPELFLSIQGKRNFLGFKNSYNTIGFAHQSNGQHGSLSRSWNRIYFSAAFERDNFAFAIKPWYRIPEDEKGSPNDPSGDDNPDIDKYMGYGELVAGYKWDEHLFSMLLRNNLRSSNNKGAIQLDWTFPLTRRIKGYVQYFNGYGESLIDYNASVNRLGVGIVLTDAL